MSDAAAGRGAMLTLVKVGRIDHLTTSYPYVHPGIAPRYPFGLCTSEGVKRGPWG